MKQSVLQMLTCFTKDFKNIEKIITCMAIEIKRKFPSKKTGRRRTAFTNVLAGIFYRCKSGCPWRSLPRIFGAYTTIHRWFMVFVQEKIFEKLWQALLNGLAGQGALNCKRLLFDGSLIQCASANEYAIYNPRRGKRCINRLVACNSQRIPLALLYARGTANDTQFLVPLLEKISCKKGFHVHADKGFDSLTNRMAVTARGGFPHIPVRNHGYAKDVPCPTEKDVHRPRVEHAFAWINNFRSLKYITDRRSDVIFQSTCIAFAIICSRFLKPRSTNWSLLCKNF